MIINKRNDVIDIAKGIGMMLVIFGHMSSFNEPIRIIICSFHMPMFFILSGYLYKKSNVTNQIKKDLRKLIKSFLRF